MTDRRDSADRGHASIPLTPLESPDLDILDTSAAGAATIRGGALRATGYVLGLFLALVSAPLLIRHLGVADYGRYATVVALVALFAAVTDAGLTVLGLREYSSLSGDARDRMLSNLLGLRIALSVAGIGAAVLFAFVAGYRRELVLGTLLQGLGIGAVAAQNTYGIPLSAELRLGWLTVADLIRQAVLTMLVVAGVLLSAGVITFFAVTIPAGAVGMAVVTWLVRSRASLAPSFNGRVWRGLMRETLPVAAAGALYNVYFRLVIILMSLVALVVETGYFAVSYRVVEILISVPYLLVTTLLPLLSRAARDDHERLRYILQGSFDVGVILGTLLALAAATGAPFVVGIIAPPSAHPAVAVLRIEALGLIPAFLSIIWQNALFALRLPRPLLVSNGIALVVTMVLTLVLVPGHQAEGAALAATMGEVTLMVATLAALLRAFPALRPRVSVVPRVAAAAAPAALLATLPAMPDVLRGAVASLVFLAALVLVRAVPPEVSGALRSWRATHESRVS